MWKRKKFRENLNIGEKVYILAERIKKKTAPGKFYKQSVQNISYFNKDVIYTVRKKQFTKKTSEDRIICFKIKFFIILIIFIKKMDLFFVKK